MDVDQVILPRAAETCGDFDEKTGNNFKSDILLEIDRSLGISVTVPMLIEGSPVDATIDTGAEVTLIGEKLFLSLPESLQKRIDAAPLNLVVAEEGKTMGSMGIIQLDVCLGSKQFSWPTYVAPITDDFLLGCDIFDALDLTLNTKQGLLVEGVWIPCTVTKKDDNIARVTLADNVIVPNNSEVIVMGKCTSLGKFTKCATVEPIFEDNRELMVARALIDTSKENIPIRLANLSDKPVKLKKGYLVGELQPVDGFAALGDRGSRSTPEADPVRMGALCLVPYAGPLISPEFCCEEGPNILKVGTRKATSPTVGTQDSSGDDKLDFMNVAGFHAVPNYLSDLYEQSCQMLTLGRHHRSANHLGEHQKVSRMRRRST